MIKEMNAVKVGYNEFANIETYCIITMITKGGKKLYLQHDKDIIKNKKVVKEIFKWSFDRSEATWFEDYERADDFCKGYFKNFTDYNIEEFDTII